MSCSVDVPLSESPVPMVPVYQHSTSHSCRTLNTVASYIMARQIAMPYAVLLSRTVVQCTMGDNSDQGSKPPRLSELVECLKKALRYKLQPFVTMYISREGLCNALSPPVAQLANSAFQLRLRSDMCLSVMK